MWDEAINGDSISCEPTLLICWVSHLNSFIDQAKMIRSHIPVVNGKTKIDVPNRCRTIVLEPEGQDTTNVHWTTLESRFAAPSGQSHSMTASQSSAPTHKCGRPVSSNDSQLWKRKPTAQTRKLV